MMKRKTLLIVALCLLSFLPARAQEGLQIDSLFSGSVVDFSDRSKITELIVTGSELKPYNLKYFRSISFKADAKMIANIAKLIEADARKAVDTKIDYQGGQLNYALLRLACEDSRENQYVGFQLKGPKGEVKGPFKSACVTVVYLRGKATMSDLNFMFKQR